MKPGSKAERSWFEKLLPKPKPAGKGPAGQQEASDGWSNGRIINLMSTDTARVDQASTMFHMTWTAPIQMIIVLVLLIINISYSALAGFGLIFLAMPLLARAIKSLFKRRKAINKITDQRVSLTQEILHAVRFVKCEYSFDLCREINCLPLYRFRMGDEFSRTTRVDPLPRDPLHSNPHGYSKRHQRHFHVYTHFRFHAFIHLLLFDGPRPQPCIYLLFARSIQLYSYTS